MDHNIIYFITGANKGIGFQITRTLLLRENTTIVATKRTFSTSSLDIENLPKTKSSKLAVITLSPESENISKVIRDVKEDIKTNTNTTEDLIERLKDEGVQRIDVLILNAGTATSFESVTETSVHELQAHFRVNTIWPIRIYQVLRPLLLRNRKEDGISELRNEGRGIQKKIIYISSSLGSVGGIEDSTPCLAYGISKAGANYFVRKVHFEEERRGVVALAVHPGWVRTHNGQAFADSVGVKEPPMSVEESVDGVLKQIDTATRKTTSGSFVSWKGDVIPW